MTGVKHHARWQGQWRVQSEALVLNLLQSIERILSGEATFKGQLEPLDRGHRILSRR